MIAPGRYCMSPERLGMVKPVISDGVISGVNWMRLNEQESERASALASVVLPTPGTSSMSTWPSHSSAVSINSTTSSLPTTARAMFCLRVETIRLKFVILSFLSVFLLICARGADVKHRPLL